MKIPIVNIRQKMMLQLADVISNAKQSKTFLQSSFNASSGPNVLIVLAGIIFILSTAICSFWNRYIILIIIGGILIYLLARQFQKLIRWKRLGRNSVFFDPLFFYSVKPNSLEIFPLIDYLDSDIVLAADKKNYFARFHFKNGTILQTSNSPKDVNTLNFQNSLSNYSRIVKQSPDGSKFPRKFELTLKDKLNANQFPLIICAFGIILLFFILPIIIDFNQFKEAKDLNTATSYRAYLSNPNNIRHRDEVRFRIKTIYNIYINEYAKKTTNSLGAKSFQQVLEYLRDKDLYNLRLIFKSTSGVANTSKPGFNIVPITQSFSSEKIISHQEDVLSTLNSTLGTIFPSDIITLASENFKELPRLEIFYHYSNKENSFYYSEKEETLQENLRTWYYGIEINWSFSLYIPTKDFPIYTFDLTSKPAPRFTSESFSPDAVYNNMIISAFDDFKSEFSRQFFNVIN
jgi:hypothetical protein